MPRFAGLTVLHIFLVFLQINSNQPFIYAMLSLLVDTTKFTESVALLHISIGMSNYNIYNILYILLYIIYYISYIIYRILKINIIIIVVLELQCEKKSVLLPEK